MGYYIRFIHNRDLATENIVTACVRSRLILSAPPGVIAALLGRMNNLGIPLPSRSILALAGDLQSVRGDLPGSYGCTIKQTRRGARGGPTPSGVELAVLQLVRSLGHPRSYKPVHDGHCQRMISGVTLNGHKYKQGHQILFLPRIRRRGNAAGPGGLEGSSTSHQVGTICMFYQLAMQGTSEGLPRHIVVVSVLVHPEVGRANQLRVVDTVREDVKLLGWDHFHDSRVHTLIHVDSITSRVMLVPHFDRSKKDSQMCVIPMWKAR